MITYLSVCTGCAGEGRQNVPRYEHARPNIPIRVRRVNPCPVCYGIGYVPASQAEIGHHTRMVTADYAATGMRWAL